MSLRQFSGVGNSKGRVAQWGWRCLRTGFVWPTTRNSTVLHCRDAVVSVEYKLLVDWFTLHTFRSFLLLIYHEEFLISRNSWMICIYESHIRRLMMHNYFINYNLVFSCLFLCWSPCFLFTDKSTQFIYIWHTWRGWLFGQITCTSRRERGIDSVWIWDIFAPHQDYQPYWGFVNSWLTSRICRSKISSLIEKTRVNISGGSENS